MKKVLFIVFISFISICTWAAKAWNMPIIVTQPDGTTLYAYQHGDEHFNWYCTKDSVILVRQQNTFYIATIHKDGHITSSGQLAHEANTRQAAERQLIDKQNKKLFFAQARTQWQTRTTQNHLIKTNNTYFPHTGKPKAIVILAAYKDTPFTLSNPKKSFNQFLNAEGRPIDYGNGENKNASSVKQYFKDMSFNTFEPQFDVYGPITLPNNLAYYGGTNENGHDEKFDELVTDACKLIADSLNFSTYDANNDGYVDLVYVIYAGYGQNMGAPNNTMWPKAGTITPFTTKQGTKVMRAGISNELIGNQTSPKTKMISGIGLFCHELSHCLGLPDFYPTLSDAISNNQGMEAWSLMDDGEYTANGYCPTAYTAWEREAMGWMNIEELKDAQQIQLKNIDEGGKAYRVYNDKDNNPNEYYIIQNIQNKRWNTALKGHGMLMYHVNYNADAFSLEANRVNNQKGKPRMTVVPADGLLYTSFNKDKKYYLEQLKGDLFPGTSNVTELTNQTNLPNYQPYTSETLNKPIYRISENNGIIYFNFLKKDIPNRIEQFIAPKTTISQRIYTIDGKYIGISPNHLPQGIYIIGGKKVFLPANIIMDNKKQ